MPIIAESQGACRETMGRIIRKLRIPASAGQDADCRLRGPRGGKPDRFSGQGMALQALFVTVLRGSLHHPQLSGDKFRPIVGRETVLAVRLGEVLRVYGSIAQLAVGQGAIGFDDAHAD